MYICMYACIFVWFIHTCICVYTDAVYYVCAYSEVMKGLGVEVGSKGLGIQRAAVPEFTAELVVHDTNDGLQ